MTSQDEGTPPGPAQPSGLPDGGGAFAEMFDAHAQHLFDYCYCLLGDRAWAASATQVTLIAAHSLGGRLKDSSRMRAWVLALGRRECLLSGGQGLAGPRQSDASGPDGADDLAAALTFVDEADDDIGDADTGEITLSDFEAATGLSLRAMLLALPREDWEVLDLTYRHDVSEADLAAVLGVPAGSVPGMLAAARAKFAAQGSEMARLAEADAASQDVRPDQLSALRLANLPASLWRRTARVIMDPRFRSYRDAVSAHAEHLGPDGFPVEVESAPSGRKLLLASALMAGLVLAPALAGGAGYAAFTALAHAAVHQHSITVTPSGPASGGSATGNPAGAGLAHFAGGAKRSRSKAGKQSVGTASRESGSHPAHHKPSRSPSPVPTSRNSSPVPWPSQTLTSTGSPSPSTSPTATPTPSP